MNAEARSLSAVLAQDSPVLALAPMQDITGHAFLRLLAAHGGADLYVTEYFRVTEGYRPEKKILRSIVENPTGRPIAAQIIGNDPHWMAFTARELSDYPVAAIDLNLGCPAPVVYRKCAGGGLLRDPNRVDLLLGTLRDAVTIPFTVKTRVGFASSDEFDLLLSIFSKHCLDMVTVHGRTVLEGYGPHVHYDRIAQAAAALRCPVLANGSVDSPSTAARVLESTGVRGVMIGRAAIRNPWLFAQIREHLSGQPVRLPSGRELLSYIYELYEAVCTGPATDQQQVQRLKKFTNFIGAGISAAFLHDTRRCTSTEGFFEICRRELDHDRPLSLTPEYE